MTTSELSGFHRLGLGDRRTRVAQLTGMTDQDLSLFSADHGLSDEQANRMVENVLGVMGLPLGLCVNLRVDERDCLVPMATEEPSVVAAASYAAKLLRAGGGVRTIVSPAHMIGQIQLLDVPDPDAAEAAVRADLPGLLALANSGHPRLIAAGGGAVDLEVHHLQPGDDDDPIGPMMVVHLVVDVRDAMGANAINGMCERIAPRVAELTRGRVGLRILSNLADRRTVIARAAVPFSALKGRGGDSPEQLAQGIVEASIFAERDPYRAATHNKGIMNGIDSVLLAFGQDWRAVEAGAHAFAARNGRYTALARWRVRDETLVGELELPMAVGTVGGVAGVHPTVPVARRLAGIGAASELASITAAVGLAQNLAALRAMAAEGIQQGHMRLHARNIASEAGAVGQDIDDVAKHIADRGTVNLEAAKEELATRQAARLRARDEAHGDGSGGLLVRFAEMRDRYWPSMAQLIDEVVLGANPASSSLSTMCSYHLETGGKRLRALLPLLAAEALGEPPERLLALGAACEMLHNATLVHDDLQDGDLVRRGRDTVWHRFGMPQAVNLGDAMFYYAVLLCQRVEAPAVHREAIAKRLLLDTLQVIDGQEREFLLKTSEAPSLADYFAMVEGKTSGLFALPLTAAAQLCGAPSEVVGGLQQAAQHMGVLFQIQDDTLDLFGDKGRAERGMDIAEGKRSALVVYALGKLSDDERAQLVGILDKPRDATSVDDIATATGMLEACGALDFALAEMARRREQALAIEALADVPELGRLIAGMCELFLQPIRPLLAAKSGAS